MAAERSAVLLDWGGVMTSNLFGSFATFCAEEGLDRDVLANLFRHDRDARALLIDFESDPLGPSLVEKARNALGKARRLDRIVEIVPERDDFWIGPITGHLHSSGARLRGFQFVSRPAS